MKTDRQTETDRSPHHHISDEAISIIKHVNAPKNQSSEIADLSLWHWLQSPPKRIQLEQGGCDPLGQLEHKKKVQITTRPKGEKITKPQEATETPQFQHCVIWNPAGSLSLKITRCMHLQSTTQSAETGRRRTVLKPILHIYLFIPVASGNCASARSLACFSTHRRC